MQLHIFFSLKSDRLAQLFCAGDCFLTIYTHLTTSHTVNISFSSSCIYLVSPYALLCDFPTTLLVVSTWQRWKVEGKVCDCEQAESSPHAPSESTLQFYGQFGKTEQETSGRWLWEAIASVVRVATVCDVGLGRWGSRKLYSNWVSEQI